MLTLTHHLIVCYNAMLLNLLMIKISFIKPLHSFRRLYKSEKGLT